MIKEKDKKIARELFRQFKKDNKIELSEFSGLYIMIFEKNSKKLTGFVLGFVKTWENEYNLAKKMVLTQKKIGELIESVHMTTFKVPGYRRGGGIQTDNICAALSGFDLDSELDHDFLVELLIKMKIITDPELLCKIKEEVQAAKDEFFKYYK